MTGALSPGAALALVASLTPGLRRAVVTGRNGTCLAGDPALAGPAGRALQDAGGGDARTAKGLHVVGDERHAVAVETGAEVLGGLLLADLRRALEALRDA
jgi:hypothetical protein